MLRFVEVIEGEKNQKTGFLEFLVFKILKICHKDSVERVEQIFFTI